MADLRDTVAATAPTSLPARDRVLVAMLVAFTLFNLTLDLALVVDAGRLTEPPRDWAAAKLFTAA